MLRYFDAREIKELLISAMVACFVFSFDEIISGHFMEVLGLSIAIFLGFVLHESAHKIAAIKLGNYARFVMWREGLLFAIFLAFITMGHFVFIAPGAVYIGSLGMRRIGSRENAIISAAGPITNIILAAVFAVLFILFKNPVFAMVTLVNGYLAFFNLLPIPPLDGSKIIWYSIPMWIALMLPAVYFAFIF